MHVSSRSKRKKLFFYMAVAAVAIISLCHTAYYFPRTVDDMFISLRYAENLALGDGPVYNPGERVEGFSSPLWVVLLSVGAVLGVGGVTFSKILAVPFFALLLFGLYALAREHLGMARWAALLVPAAVAFDAYVVSWTLFGLETPAYLALLVWSAVFVNRLENAPSRRTTLLAIGVGAAACLTRPEAPFFVALIALAFLIQPLKPGEIRARAKRIAVPAALVVLIVIVYFLFRRAYYGLWFPHTFYAKNASGFHWRRWAALWSEGALPTEIMAIFGALLAAVVAAVRRQSMLFLLVLAGELVFTASVIVDWMLNQRHLLPLWVLAPLLLAWAADRSAALFFNKQAGRKKRIAAAVSAAVFLGIVAGAAPQQCQIDSRYSPMDFKSHGGGQRWFFAKSRAKWNDTWMCLRREVPPHVREMGSFSMGMITQLYRLLEADDRPLEETWYIGRDIGRVGYLSGVRVFDTDGLFTPEVVRDVGWRDRKAVSDELLESAFDRPVVATELFGPWQRAAKRNPRIRERYEPVSSRDSRHFRDRHSKKPSGALIEKRYRRALGKLPEAYYLMTLYGEGVGAAIDRRFEIVTER